MDNMLLQLSGGDVSKFREFLIASLVEAKKQDYKSRVEEAERRGVKLEELEPSEWDSVVIEAIEKRGVIVTDQQ